MDLAVTTSHYLRVILAIGLATLFGACSANYKSINRQFHPTSGDSRLIDAKQRAIISVKRDVVGADGRRVIGPEGKPVTDLAVCAEPSPDALQATATALAGAVSGEELKAALNFSFSGSESVASIGLRTQTIQLLRDAYYRLCEAFLNDGIDSIAYDVLQRRFQNQIIALLAVEQLTGTVKAEQIALNTSASGNAGAQAALIAQMLETVEEDLLRLQEEEAAHETKLKTVEAEKVQLEATKKKADEAVGKETDPTKKSELQQKAAEAKRNLDVKNDEIKALKRRRASLEGRIERKKSQIATLTIAFGEAASATITSKATGVGTFGGDGTTSNPSHKSDVANAVRAITLNAINQDYEAQVCFEALRYRNNVSQFKNEVNYVFDSQRSKKKKHKEGTIFSKLKGTVFIDYCEMLFREQVKFRGARSKLIHAHALAITHLVKKIDDAKSKVSAGDVVKIVLALSQAAPTEPGAAFLARSIKIKANGNETDLGIKNRTSPGESVEAIQKELVVPITTEAGPLSLVLRCAAGEKLNASGTECVDRCGHEGVEFDSKLNECVPKAPAQD